ncbi:NAD(P)/FAD-dependent oxidoreductase [Amycolatopsis sp. VC5-11]|uniref:NAD(P)/FAD-dependent oxidoreductase n=1 Tax=Amycolatopsis sp. VC5-11 TaxID=3120156 RepID=UPI00300AD030
MLTRGGTVVIGAGHAGFAAATALRDTGVDGPVTLLDVHCGLPYQRPPLSKAYLLGKADRARVAFRPAAYYERREITLRTGQPAVAIDRSARTVRLRSGETVGYDTLVLATGARPRPLPVPGHDLGGVLVLRTLPDADALRARLETARRPVVIGGGFIGLEFAAVAAAGGTPVTIVEAAQRILSRSVSAHTAAQLEKAHHGWGNTVRTGTGVQRIIGGHDGHAIGVRLADGTDITADLVVVGVGAVPETALAESAGLAVDDGIVTDRYLRTSDPSVFAIGDCARIAERNGSRTRRRESVQNATDQARTVARTIGGAPAAYTASPWFWSDQHQLKLQIAGDLTGYDEAVTAPGEGAFSTYCFRHGQLVAVESVNRPTDHVAARKLLERTDVSLSQRAVGPGFALADFLKFR